MKVLVVGGGGREHALAWKLSQSPEINELLIAPGNDGVALEPNVRRAPVSLGGDYAELLTLIEREQVEFVVIGPDQALADGLVDILEKKGVSCFGPTKAAAQIESSKAFSKALMAKAGIPTARFAVFESAPEAKAFIENCDWSEGVVVKADGLALGKGVVVASSKNEAISCVDEFITNAALGEAGKKIVVEERLLGREVSSFYVCDGYRGVLLANACDYKQIYDGGLGPNTGGMGAFSPAHWLPEDFDTKIQSEVVSPLLQVMREMGVPFRGILFIGIMQTESGPKVLEFNARFGDPETQTILPLLESDLFPLLKAAASGELSGLGNNPVRLANAASVHVVLAAQGYPGAQGTPVRKGDAISITPELLPGAHGQKERSRNKLFFAGVRREGEQFLTNGGRVLGLTVTSESLEKARELVYSRIRGIHFDDAQMRTDIGR